MMVPNSPEWVIIFKFCFDHLKVIKTLTLINEVLLTDIYCTLIDINKFNSFKNEVEKNQKQLIWAMQHGTKVKVKVDLTPVLQVGQRLGKRSRGHQKKCPEKPKILLQFSRKKHSQLHWRMYARRHRSGLNNVTTSPSMKLLSFDPVSHAGSGITFPSTFTFNLLASTRRPKKPKIFNAGPIIRLPSMFTWNLESETQ